MLRICESKSGVLLLRLIRPNPMKPIPPERREGILAGLTGPAHGPTASSSGAITNTSTVPCAS